MQYSGSDSGLAGVGQVGRLKDTLLKDLWLKVFSLVFAIFLWMSIVGGESAEELFIVPVTIRNIPENMIISSDVIDFVNVQVRGQQALLKTLKPRQINIDLNLQDAVEGDNNVTLFHEEVTLPDGLTVVRISPSQLAIKLDRLYDKVVPVVPTFMGTPSAGYETGQVTATPDRVAIMGLQEALREVVGIETKHIDLFGKDRSFSQEVGLNSPNGNIRIKGGHTVKVGVEILEKRGERQFQDLPVQMREPRVGVTIAPPQVTLTVRGPESVLKKLADASIEVILPEVTEPGTHEVVPEVRLPGECQLQKMEPAEEPQEEPQEESQDRTQPES
jgi:YbbR domain-containing protein